MIFRVCRHIKTDGVQCQSPALREDKFCYFHNELRRRHQSLAAKADTSTMRPTYDRDGKFTGMEPLGKPSGGIDLGLLEDTQSVQVAISTVVNALATNRLDVRRATALLYGLQLAASNCRSLMKDLTPNPDRMLRETIDDGSGEPIASPGLNSGNVWVYPEDPEKLNEDEQEELRREEQGGENQGVGSETGRENKVRKGVPLPEFDEDEDFDESEDCDEDCDCEEGCDCDEDCDCDGNCEPGEGDDADLDDAACERVFVECCARVREQLGPVMAAMASRSDGAAQPACFQEFSDNLCGMKNLHDTQT